MASDPNAPRSSHTSRLKHAREGLEQADCNLSPEHKDIIARAGAAFNRPGQFADTVMMRTRMLECNTFVRPEDGTTQARVVFELVVSPGALACFCLSGCND